MKKLLITLTIFLSLTFSINALELKEGRIKLILHENSGKISVFYQNKLISEEYTSLLLQQDPRTSGITLLVNNKTQRLGDSFEFQRTIRETLTGAEFNWKSKTLDVTESFSFVTSAGSSIADGIKIDISIENISEETMSIGMKYLFDTYLGESNRQKVHFYTSNNTEIKSETVFKGIMPDYWISSAGFNSDTGLLMMLDSDVVTSPDKVIFSNWKRLDESGWTLNVKEGRNFNLLPYSIDDSAVSHYYDPIRIPQGSKRFITIVMGNVSKEGFTSTDKVETSSSLSDLYKRVSTDTASGNFESLENSVKNELTLTEDLITHIDRLINSKQPLSDDELNTLTIMIDKLENTLKKIED